MTYFQHISLLLDEMIKGNSLLSQNFNQIILSLKEKNDIDQSSTNIKTADFVHLTFVKNYIKDL